MIAYSQLRIKPEVERTKLWRHGFFWYLRTFFCIFYSKCILTSFLFFERFCIQKREKISVKMPVTKTFVTKINYTQTTLRYKPPNGNLFQRPRLNTKHKYTVQAK